MGGTLALQLAALIPEAVSGVVTVNAPLFLGNPEFACAVMSGRPADPLPGWDRTEFMGSPVPEFTYSQRSRKSGADLLAMAALAREALPRVVAPLLALHSLNDQVVPLSSAEEIIGRAGSAVKSLVPLTRSMHAAQLDQDRDRIVELAVTFTRA
jgi:carboxylesterase